MDVVYLVNVSRSMKYLELVIIGIAVIATSALAADRRHVAPQEVGPVLYRMPVDGITALAPASAGGVWYLPDFLDPPFIGRLTRYDGIQLSSLNASQIASAEDGSLWLASRAALVRVGSDGIAVTYPATAGYISAITFDLSGRPWFINRDARLVGFFDRMAQRIVEYPLPASLSEPKFVVAGPDGKIWVVTAKGGIGIVSADGVVAELETSELRGQPVTAVASTAAECWIAIGCRSCNHISCPFPDDRGAIIAISASREWRVVTNVGHNDISALAAGQDGSVFALKAIMSVFDGSFHPGPLLVIRPDGSIRQLATQLPSSTNGASAGMLAVSSDGGVWGAFTNPNVIFRFPSWQVR